MARTLNTYVLVGDRLYEPGTAESDVDGEITADVWDEPGATDSKRRAKPAPK